MIRRGGENGLMQFLEHSVIGLRAARHVLASSRHVTRVSLFPMVHVGEQDFYDHVYGEARAHDVVILEGVRSAVVDRLTRVYRRAGIERLGLVVQPRLDFRKMAVRAVHADLSGPEFEAEWRKIPLATRIMMQAGSAGMALSHRLFATREVLGRHLNTTDLPDRETIFMLDPVVRALTTARDARLCAKLEAEIRAGTGSVAVVYGAAHMGAVTRRLSELGDYRPVESEWLTIMHY